jgi:Pyruvate phosphate dikinase, AMP/ATP-binding domain
MGLTALAVPAFDRGVGGGAPRFTRIGPGELGGKAQGLAFIRETIASHVDPECFSEFVVTIPRLTVLGTGVFDRFIERNKLAAVSESDLSDDRIALAFQRADLPVEFLGDLRALVEEVRTPLAIRSSSLLEDSIHTPFAGVYATKMTPNNQLDADSRFRRLVEAVKFVYASTYFREARRYRRAAGCAGGAEKMAVIVQEVVGRPHGGRYYPDVSGVARSFNYYPSGHALPSEGVVELALGLGKTVVDGETAWAYSPAYPKAPAPFNSLGDLLKNTQTQFWAVNTGKPPAWDPLSEAEYLLRCGIPEAEADGTLHHVASTFDVGANRITSGVGGRGPRIINFAPILVNQKVALNDLVKALLAACEASLGGPVEIEFAVSLGDERSGTALFGFLQVRPLAMAVGTVEVADEDLRGSGVLLAAEHTLGNGAVEDVADIVFVRRDSFDPAVTSVMARELESLNQSLVDEGRPYLLVGPGRWGTSDPRGGIPVKWDSVSGVRAIVETTLPGMRPELSQGSHFFHNLTSFRVLYFTVPAEAPGGIDWDWLERRPPARETAFLRHLRLAAPLDIRVDGRTGRGVIIHRD